MKKLKLFFALFAMLALGVGNAWAADVTFVFKTIAQQSGTTDGISWTTGKTGSATTTACNSNYGLVLYGVTSGGGYFQTTSPTSGVITNVNIVASPKKNTPKYTIYGSTDGNTWTAIESNITISNNTTKDHAITGSYTYFKIANTTAATAQLAITTLTITYETSGSGEPAVSVPTFSVPEGTFYSPINVELSCSTADAEIYYTLDGNTPSSTSEKYTTAIAISETTTIKAIAVKDGLTDSEVATATYTKGETVTSYDIDFETNALEAYVNWDFSNITITTATIEAKAGTYYANTSGKASASIKTKEVIQYPGILTFYTSKESGNTTSSSWKVQVSENGTTWTDVTSFDATTGDKGDWTERTADLSDYENVYVQISYSGSTAIRAIDEISLAQGVAPVKYTLTIENPENGTLSVTKGGVSVVSGEQFKAGTSLVVTPTPASGYLFESLTVDGTEVELSEGKYTLTMPENDVTISATFKPNEKPAATLTLSKNGETELLPGNHKQDDVVTLPDFESECSKTFVGWDADENCDHAPTYAPGAEYTLAAETQTLYAVYADSESGEVVTQTLTITDQTTNSTYGNNSFTDNKGGVWSGQSNIPDATHFGLRQNDDNTHMASPVFPNNIINITAKIRNQSKSERKVYLCSNNTTAKPSSGDLGGVNVNGSVTDIEHTFTLNGTFNQFYIYTNGALQFNEIEVTYSSAPTYSNYSTTCAAAPKAEVTPTEVTATAAGVEGKVTVTYENVNTENVAVALFNDEACTEAFTAGWLTASLDGDKNITYTVAATTLYTERKAYIQLTAPEANGTTEPAKVVIPVTQAGKEKVFGSLEELLANITPTTEGVEVTVTLTNELIVDFYTSVSYRNGIALNVPYQGGTKQIEIYCKDVPAEWVKGGKVSGTITCPWKLYNSTWELCPTAWSELTYTAPATVKSIAVSGNPTKITYVDGEVFDPAGLVVTATLTDDSTEPIEFALVDWTFDPATLAKGQTSVNVTAQYNILVSPAYEVTGLTVNDIPTKTVAEFIAAGGTRCYLEGIVSDIDNTTYGNFNLTDASGTIYVYGCLNAAGEEQKFADLGVKNGDKIKVIADEYELYGGTKNEAKNVQYVSHVSAATITITDITMEVGETKTIAATITPDAAKTEVTYSIKAGSDDCITLSKNNITAKAEGTATIVATIATAEGEYMGKTVEFKVTVNAKSISDEVVILAEYNGNWYALKATEGTGSNSLAALEVTYFNGTLYNVEDADKLLITWERVVVGDKVTFKNGENYLTGGSSTALTLANASFEWTYKVEDGQDTYIYEYEDNGTKARTFLYYNGGYFKNYATSNAKPTETNYSGYPVVTAPVYAAGDIVYTREGLTNGKFGTICLPYGSTEYSGATFFKIAYRETGKVYIDEVTTLEAGVPYIFQAKSATLTVTCEGEAVGDAGSANGLYGTFIEIADVAAHTSNKGYILTNNLIRFCEANCNVPANRAYIVLDEISTEKTPAPINRRRVGMSVQGENETTGVEDLFTTESPAKVIENGQLIIIRNGEKFNVQGQKL